MYINAQLRSLDPSLVLGRHVAGGRVAAKLALALGEALHRPLARSWKADIVHETYYGPRRRAPRGARIVLTVYDMIHELFADEFADDSVIRAKAAAVARADRILCISESTRRDLLRFHPGAADRALVTLLGFDPPGAEPPLLSKPAERPYLLYVGPRRGYKNFAGLLDALASSRALRTTFDLVCIGGGALANEELRRIDELGLSGQVRQAEADDAALAAWYRGAALFAYPSLYEGFGIPPLEAMARGCPVVTMRSSSIPEVCGDAAEYAEPAQDGSLVAALERVAFDAGRADALRRAGRENLARFSWQRTARETARIYKEIA
jgi:glycosyltransferase involved in cell wall biosynthesis